MSYSFVPLTFSYYLQYANKIYSAMNIFYAIISQNITAST